MSDLMAAMNRSMDLAVNYGVKESNPLWASEVTHEDIGEHNVKLSDKRLVRIVRLRLLTEPEYPHYDISYCYGQLDDGSYCRVDLGTSFLTRKNAIGELIELAKEAGRFAKGMGLLDRTNVWSVLS